MHRKHDAITWRNVLSWSWDHKKRKEKKPAFLLTFYKKERSLGRQNVLFFLPMGVHDKDLTLKVLKIVQKWQSKVWIRH
jgi:hypothetical protein